MVKVTKIETYRKRIWSPIERTRLPLEEGIRIDGLLRRREVMELGRLEAFVECIWLEAALEAPIEFHIECIHLSLLLNQT
jgi:hypothetical protein